MNGFRSLDDRRGHVFGLAEARSQSGSSSVHLGSRYVLKPSHVHRQNDVHAAQKQWPIDGATNAKIINTTHYEEKNQTFSLGSIQYLCKQNVDIF